MSTILIFNRRIYDCSEKRIGEMFADGDAWD